MAQRSSSPAAGEFFSVVNGRQICYRWWPGDGVPVLLLHGVGLCMENWGRVPDLLAEAGLPVLAVDLPGHGRSDGGKGDYSIGATAATVRDLMDQLGVEHVHLVGHSLGGGIAMQFSYQFPERSRRLVLVSSGGLGPETASALRAASLPGASLVMRMAITTTSIRAARTVSALLGAAGMHPQALDPDVLETAERLTSNERREAFLETLRSVVDRGGQRVSALERLHIMDGSSVLIVWGSADPVIPVSHAVRGHQLLPGSTLEIFDGAGHEPHRTDPQRLARAVLKHLGISA